VLLLLGAVQFVPAVAMAEALYSGYSLSAQPLSDLGATCRTVSEVTACTIHEPSAWIFDASVVVLGLMALLAGYLVFESGGRALGTAILLAGIGAVSVGVFPETTGVVHLLASFIAFFFSGVSAVLSFRASTPPLSYVFVVLGLVVLLSLALYATDTYLGLGQGGMERLIAYPALLWAAAFGAALAVRRAGGPFEASSQR
jgi:hypothetical membrane protein